MSSAVPGRHPPGEAAARRDQGRRERGRRLLTRASLEDILGVELYTRGPRGLTPTVFGWAFTTHARAVISQLTEAAAISSSWATPIRAR
jgi:hypothetical protein